MLQGKARENYQNPSEEKKSIVRGMSIIGTESFLQIMNQKRKKKNEKRQYERDL